MNVRAVVTRPYGAPMQGVTVDFVATADGTIMDTGTTDTGGAVTGTVTGPFFVRPRVTGDYHRVLVTSFGNYPCYDAVVDESGHGTHTTLADAIATACAATRGSHFSIWLCNNETVSSSIALPSATGSSGVVTISIETAASRVEVTTPGGNGLIYASNVNTNYYRFRWRNIDFVGTGSGDPWATLNVNTGGEECSNEFWNCSWSNSYGALIRQTVIATGPQGHTHLYNSTGTFTYFYQETVSNAQGYPGSWRIAEKCSFTVTSGLWTLGSGIHPVGGFTIEGASDITSTGNNFVGGFSFNGMSLVLREATITHTGSGHCIVKMPGTTNYIRDVTIICSNAAARAISSSGASGTDYIDGLIAINTAGSAQYAVNISGDTVYLGTVLQSGYAGPYTGVAPSGGIDHGALTGLSDDDHTSYHTDARALTWLGTRSTSDLPEGSNKYYTDERVDDRVAALIQDSDTVTWTYDDASNTLSAEAAAAGGGGLVSMVADPLGIEWTDMPAALTELFGLTNTRTKVDLTNAAEVRLVVNVLTAGATGAVLRGQYSTDGSTWDYLDGATGPEVAIDATGVGVSTVVSLDAGAQADVFLRVVGIDGDGAADPVFGLVMLQFDAVTSGGGGGGGAPTSTPYVTTAADATLSAEVVRQQLGNYFADTYPASANAMDDEFDDSSGMSGSVNGLDARWSWVNQGTSSISWATQGYLALTPQTAAGANFRLLVQSKPAGDYTVAMKLSLDGIRANWQTTGIVLYDSVGGDLYCIALSNGASTNNVRIITQRFNSVSSYNSDTVAAVGLGMFTGPLYIKMKYTSATNTVTVYYSNDGLGWIQWSSFTDAVGHDKVGIGADFEGSNAGTLYVDWFRRLA